MTLDKKTGTAGFVAIIMTLFSVLCSSGIINLHQ